MDSLSSKQLHDLHDIFSHIDRNHNGMISAHEMGTVLRAFGAQVTDFEVQDLIAEVDVGEHGGDGVLDFAEFVVMLTRRYGGDEGPDKKQAANLAAALRPLDADEELEEAFAWMDKDDDGVLSVRDVVQAFAEVGDEYTELEVQEMLAEVGGSGQLAGQSRPETGKSQKRARQRKGVRRDEFVRTLLPTASST